MANSAGIVSIYPNGRGRYALGSPDGATLLPGQPLTVLLSGHEITGTLEHGDQGDYLRTPDGTICGLCANMRVMSSSQAIDGSKLGTWVRHDCCWIDQRDGEAFIGNHFALFRVPTASLPDFLCPAFDGTYEYDGQVLREEEERASWMRRLWQNILVAPTLAKVTPTETLDCPVFGQRYRGMIDDQGVIRWMDAGVLEIFASTFAGLTTYRFEAVSNGFRVYAPDDATPVAIVSERVKREVAR